MIRSFALLSIIACSVAATAQTCPTGQSKTGDALIQAEQTWAKALEQHDSATLGCLLADTFQDADPDGKLHTRAETLTSVPARKPGVNKLSELDPHVFGDTGYIRGLATLYDPEGKMKAQVRFTDIYVYREGRWQCVAGQETLLPQAK
jgi:ketosteroid isomerase-like protein